jgi:hypothetical protein
MPQRRDHSLTRWIFGDYVVFASNASIALQVYEAASNRLDSSTLFGKVEFDGESGNWVHIISKRKKRSF